MKIQVKSLALLAALIVAALFLIVFAALPSAFSCLVAAIVEPWFDSLTPADSMKVDLLGKFIPFAVLVMVPPLGTAALAALLRCQLQGGPGV